MRNSESFLAVRRMARRRSLRVAIRAGFRLVSVLVGAAAIVSGGVVSVRRPLEGGVLFGAAVLWTVYALFAMPAVHWARERRYASVAPKRGHGDVKRYLFGSSASAGLGAGLTLAALKLREHPSLALVMGGIGVFFIGMFFTGVGLLASSVLKSHRSKHRSERVDAP